MNVLLLSMPDAFEHTPTIGMCMPNGALASLAGNVDAHHDVAIADLVLVPSAVAATVERLVREQRPAVIGISAMTFQRRTALELVRRIRAWRPEAAIVAGGYDPSLATAAWVGRQGVDFVVGSGTKALDGRDRNLWGYVASNRIEELNACMDILAMRGGILDEKRSRSVLSGLDRARQRFAPATASERPAIKSKAL